jgi:hypothetical protein
MKYSHNQTQKSLFSLGMMKIEIPEDNELIKMEQEIDWEAMTEIIGSMYSDKKGRNSKSLRMMIGLEIAKRRYGLSDEAIVAQLEVDVALKIFCGFNEWQHDIPEASSLTRFRNRLDEKTLQKLEEVNVRKMIRKVPRRNRYQVITDSTCIEANITYPTDSKLLSKTFEKLVHAAQIIRKEGAEFVIRGKLKTKRAIRSFHLKRRKSKRVILKMNKKLIRESRKVIRIIREHVDTAQTIVKDRVKNIVKTAETIIAQQKVMIENKVHRVKNRIVSFHETEIRPIFRGKEGKQTEFGPKVAINVIGGRLVQTTKLSNNNFSDTEMVEAGLDTNYRTFGRDPTEFIADRGAHSPKNHELLNQKNIMDGIQYRGKIPKKAKLPPSSTGRRMYKQRSTVEGKIGTFKTGYGGHRNKYKNKNAQCLISFGFIAMNAKWAATGT